MKLTIHRKTCTGKIARLPHAVREELNRRLQNGETGKVILPWLNALPAVRAVLAAQFAAGPVNHQNLSNWRHSGYQDWLEEQRHSNLARELSENAEEIAPNNGAPVIANNLSTVLMAELAISMYKERDEQNELTHPSDRLDRLREIIHTVCAVRREDHRAAWVGIHRERHAFALAKALERGRPGRCDLQPATVLESIRRSVASDIAVLPTGRDRAPAAFPGLNANSLPNPQNSSPFKPIQGHSSQFKDEKKL